MFAVQNDGGEIMRCTLTYGATVLPMCPCDEKGHKKHDSSGAFHAGIFSKVVEMLHPHSGDIFLNST
jgi:hypothetical protein